MRFFEKITAENLTASAPLYIRKRERQKSERLFVLMFHVEHIKKKSGKNEKQEKKEKK